ncbi:unnamed protein product [Cercospora beticola]|nr:unnamed protein product [Cercospora beticola]
MAGPSSKTGKAGDQQVTNADKHSQNHGISKSHSPVGRAASKGVHQTSIPAQSQARDAKPAKFSSAPTSQDHASTSCQDEAKAGSTKPSPESVTVEKDQKVAENSSGSEPKATGEWGDIYDDISDDDDEASDDDDEDDGFDDAARPGQTATQYGWL